jgi:FdhD protein
MKTIDSDRTQEGSLKYVAVQKMSKGQWANQVVSVINEMAITVFLNGKEIVTLLCTGFHLKALAVGFLHSEGLIHQRYDIQEITVDEKKGQVHVTTVKDAVTQDSLPRKRTVASGCGQGIVFYPEDTLIDHKVESSLTLNSEQVFFLMSQLTQQSDLYRKTRGVHNAALASHEGIMFFRSDIGRHNAVDMICGNSFLENVSLEDKILLTTGRISSEILLKVAKIRIPILISRNVATYHAIALAQSIGITLVGDVRGTKFVVYSHPERVNK